MFSDTIKQKGLEYAKELALQVNYQLLNDAIGGDK
jgi:hypothetical protein